MATVTIHHYPGCGTCKKARKWLDAQGIAHTLHDLVDDPIPRAELADLVARSGLDIKRFFNTSGQSYRGGGFKDRLPGMDLDDKLDALAADGKLVKRPIADLGGGAVLVGFKEADWAAAFEG